MSNHIFTWGEIGVASYMTDIELIAINIRNQFTWCILCCCWRGSPFSSAYDPIAELKSLVSSGASCAAAEGSRNILFFGVRSA